MPYFLKLIPILTVFNLCAFTLNNNANLHFTNRPITINMARGNCQNVVYSEDEILKMAQTAIEQFWNTAPNSSLELSTGSLITSPHIDYKTGLLCSSTTNGSCNINNNFTKHTQILITCNSASSNYMSRGSLAVGMPTSYRASASAIDAAVVLINDTPGTAINTISKTEFIVTLAHELGHAIGFGHSSVQDSLMYYTFVPDRKRLGLDDMNAASYLYPNETLVSCNSVAHQSRGNKNLFFSLILGLMVAFIISKFKFHHFFLLMALLSSSLYATEEWHYTEKKILTPHLFLLDFNDVMKANNFYALSLYPRPSIPLVNADQIYFKLGTNELVVVKLNLKVPTNMENQLYSTKDFKLFHKDGVAIGFYGLNQKSIDNIIQNFPSKNLLTFNLLFSPLLNRAEASECPNLTFQVPKMFTSLNNFMNLEEKIKVQHLLMNFAGNCLVSAWKQFSSEAEAHAKRAQDLSYHPLLMWAETFFAAQNATTNFIDSIKEMASTFMRIQELSPSEYLNTACQLIVATSATSLAMKSGNAFSNFSLHLKKRLSQFEENMKIMRELHLNIKGSAACIL